MGRTVVGWVMTLVVVGTLSAILMAMGIYSPNLSASKAIANIRNNVNNVSMVATDLLESECVGDALVDAELLVRCLCLKDLFLNVPPVLRAMLLLFELSRMVSAIPLLSC